jgi:hypothetical protein
MPLEMALYFEKRRESEIKREKGGGGRVKFTRCREREGNNERGGGRGSC